MRKWPIPEQADPSDEVAELFRQWHPYGGVARLPNLWVAREAGRIVAAWTWQPPPAGAAKAVGGTAPGGVLALSRMVAVPRAERDWHLSKPLKWLMRRGLDRGRWPVLVTYSDAGEGHCGNVYKCSGWQKDGARRSPRFNDADGNRRSSYSAGAHRTTHLVRAGASLITRWVHRTCEPGAELEHMESNGWRLVETGGRWRSGNPKRKWIRNA